MVNEVERKSKGCVVMTVTEQHLFRQTLQIDCLLVSSDSERHQRQSGSLHSRNVDRMCTARPPGSQSQVTFLISIQPRGAIKRLPNHSILIHSSPCYQPLISPSVPDTERTFTLLVLMGRSYTRHIRVLFWELQVIKCMILGVLHSHSH